MDHQTTRTREYEITPAPLWMRWVILSFGILSLILLLVISITIVGLHA